MCSEDGDGWTRKYLKTGFSSCNTVPNLLHFVIFLSIWMATSEISMPLSGLEFTMEMNGCGETLREYGHVYEPRFSREVRASFIIICPTVLIPTGQWGIDAQHVMRLLMTGSPPIIP
jgi:hypothetical protein